MMIEKHTFKFLADLKENNNRDWFLQNKASYDKAKANFADCVTELIAGIAKFDKAIGALTAKDCMFRINRDVRFSANKSPYKNNFGAIFSAGGKKSNVAGYYFHIEANKAFLAGGKWMPEAPELAAIRQEIDYNTKEFKKIISSKEFVANFKELSQDDKLKTAPKGYPKDHPEVEILKLKSFVAAKNFSSKEMNDKDFLKNCVSTCKAILPLNTFLNKAVG